MIHQTVSKERIPFRLILGLMVLMIFISDSINLVLVFLPSTLRVLGALVAFIGMIYCCFQIIYYRLAEYHYRVREEELVFERVVGRSNHAFIIIPNKDFISIEPYEPYKQHRIVKRDFFAHKKDSSGHYVITFYHHTAKRSIVISPNDELRDYLYKMEAVSRC